MSFKCKLDCNCRWNGGMTLLVVEQNVRQSLEVADKAYVMENGRIVSEEKSRELLQNDHIKKAYLGL